MSKHVSNPINDARSDGGSPWLTPAVIALTGLLACGTAAARKSDRDQPAEIDAGHFVGELKAGVRRFTEGFNLRQGTLNVDAEEATVYVDDQGRLQRIVLTGGPVVWREELDNGESLMARAGEIDYDFGAARAVLKKDVVIDRGPNQISGDTVSYDLDTQRLDAGEGEGRVKMRITPTRTDTDS